jgi:uncharacterized protein (TIGR00255 family)
MIKSMTGFGRHEETDGNRKFSVEMKAVNHRYVDMNIKMPRKFNAYESKIRNLVKEYIFRGKVDIYINYEDVSKKDVQVKYNKEIAKEYYHHLTEMASDFGIDNDVRTGMLSRYPEVFTMEEVKPDEEELWIAFERVLIQALEQMVETRKREGENLKNDLVMKLDGILDNVAFIETKSPQIVEDYKEGLRAKIADLIDDSNFDEARLLTEVTIFADKVCVDEELVRLRSHVEGVKETLLSGATNVGRKLDFIAQEMNREANTILSKTNDIEVSERAIELKAEIEKVREQIQNIE